MDKKEISHSNASVKQAEETIDEAKFQELVQSLPKERNLYGSFLYFYQGLWCPSPWFKGIISFQNHFQALDDDIILACSPKSGTTWLKSLIFTIANRKRFDLKTNPLLSSNPHELVPFLEIDIYLENNPSLCLENNLSNPRIFSTHMSYASLPNSIKHSKCKIVYVCRNPLDVFISYWHFTDQFRFENINPISLNGAFEKFCQGIHSFGPFYDHVLGYWNATHDVTNKILFLKYEDLKENSVLLAKELAEFLGFQFSKEEEEEGMIGQVVKLCSFESLRSMEVNNIGKLPIGIPHATYFRKGIVGDWSNHLTTSMAETLENLVRHKLDKTGLTYTNQLSYYPKQ